MFVGGVASSAADLPDAFKGMTAPAPLLANVPDPAKVVPPAPPAPAFSFASPLPGREVGSPFGLRRLPWEPTGRLHEGVDIAAPSGETVHVTCAGTVTKAGTSPSYGHYVEVTHADGFTSFYAHLARVAKGVRPGLVMVEGQAVGTVGDSGHSTGAHLHFEMRQNGRLLNPEMFIGKVFATLAELPTAAARVIPRHVRLAQVSSRPGWTLAANTAPRRGHRVHTVVAAAD